MLRDPSRLGHFPHRWLPVHSIEREDKKPSAAINEGNNPRFRGIYVDQGASGYGKFSFFDLLSRMTGSLDQVHATFMPDATQAVSRFPLGLSWSQDSLQF